MGIYSVAALYALLSLVLSVRLFHKMREADSLRLAMKSLASWVLLGFVVETAIRSVALFVMAATGKGEDNLVAFPAVLYFVLIFLLLLLWDRYVTSRQGQRHWFRVVSMIVLAITTALFTAFIVWRLVARETMFKHQESVVTLLDGVICIVGVVNFVNVGRQLHKEWRRGGMEDKNGLRLLRGCVFLGLFTLCRGIWIAIVVFTPSLQNDGPQSIIIPCFYAAQWLALIGSVALLSGPQRESEQSSRQAVSQRYKAAAEVAYVTSKALHSPLHSPRRDEYTSLNAENDSPRRYV